MVKKGKEQPENQLAELWQRYFPYWPVLAVILLISLATGWYYLQHQLSLYSATGSVLIKDQQVRESDKGTEDLKPIERVNTLDNEIEMIKSKDLMVSVVRKLSLYAPTFTQGRFITQSAYETSPIVVSSLLPDSIKPTDHIAFSFTNDQVEIDNKKYPLHQWVATPYGQLMFDRNPNAHATEEKHEYWFSLVRPEDMAGSLVSRLSATAVKSSAIVYVTLIDDNSLRAVNTVNELLTQYCEKYVNEKKALALSTLKFVDGELARTKGQLDSAEHQVQQVKSSGGQDINSQSALLLGNLNANDQKIADIQVQLNVLDKLRNYVVNHDQTGGLAPSTLGLSDPALGDLISRFSGAQLEAEKIKKKSGENNPEMTGVRVELEKTGNLILENIMSQKQNLLASQASLQASNGRFMGELQNLPVRERQLIDVSRDQSIKNNIYTFLLQKKEDAKLSLESLYSDSKIVDRAFSPRTPVSPSSKKVYAIAIILSLLIWLGGITIRDMLNGKVLYRSDIEQYTKVPILTEISYTRKQGLMTELQDTKFAFIAEQFRKLRTSLTFLGVGAKRRKIVITSSIPGEGKSFVAANLGLSLALTGKKVMILEFDLMNPTLGKKLNVDKELGLSNYLVGTHGLKELITPVPGSENLFFIAAGPMPENPSELITGDKVPELLQTLEEFYDYVIIDTPPIGPISDAYVLSGYADATLYVVRHKYTPKVFMKRLDRDLGINPLKNPAIVMNAVQSRGFSKGYGYGYGYGYNYSYNYRKNPSRKKLEVKKG